MVKTIFHIWYVKEHFSMWTKGDGVSKLVHSSGIGVQIGVKFGTSICWMTPYGVSKWKNFVHVVCHISEFFFTISTFVIIEKMALIFFFFIPSFAIQECILFKSKNLYRLRFPKMLSLSYDNTLLELRLTHWFYI